MRGSHRRFFRDAEVRPRGHAGWKCRDRLEELLAQLVTGTGELGTQRQKPCLWRNRHVGMRVDHEAEERRA